MTIVGAIRNAAVYDSLFSLKKTQRLFITAATINLTCNMDAEQAMA
jgi:hypothetical protein